MDQREPQSTADGLRPRPPKASGQLASLDEMWNRAVQASIGNFDDASAEYLAKVVYSLVAFSLLMFSVGAFVGVRGGLFLSPEVHLLEILVIFSCYLYILLGHPRHQGLKFAALTCCSSLFGHSYSGLLSHTVDLDPFLPLQAAIISSIVFLFFSAIALWAPRKTFAFLGSILCAASLLMFVLGLIQVCSGYSSSLFVLLQPYLLVFLTIGFILFDTQAILERFEEHEELADPVRDSAILFVDAIKLFVNVLVILARRQEERERRRREERGGKDGPRTAAK
ncbi:unnamed protein product [Cyprideis torosa]|uniref:Uncharacterized protein n=1 Tax=Cyprideis torosa TaxID=163714 RepID=A0A7R8WB15_9CRUS|nr:unnamed protein product [Cyprideis torosa]CAG0885862.1 unnamed protein product [Cyprideis torosa]